MRRHKVKMFDDNMNLEKIFFVDVLSDEEKAIKRKEEEIKDFLYSNPILRSLAIKSLEIDETTEVARVKAKTENGTFVKFTYKNI